VQWALLWTRTGFLKTRIKPKPSACNFNKLVKPLTVYVDKSIYIIMQIVISVKFNV